VEVVVMVGWEHLDDSRRPAQAVFGPTKIFAAPAATNRSTRSWASGRSI
jgi:hypothetical protein